MMETEFPTLERYEPIALHQQGSLTKVFKCLDRDTGDIVALKLLDIKNLKGGIEDPGRAELRFMREFRIIQQLDHPNIVRALDLGLTDDHYYLVMEFVGNGDLCDLLEHQTRLSEEKAWRVLIDMGNALKCAWEHELLHRDIKPGNILTDSDGTYKLTDFGLAVIRNERGMLTETDLILGTLEYASPEQLRGEEMDIRTDLYSLGVTLYELLTLTMPFSGKNPTDTMQKVCIGRKLPLKVLAPKISTELAGVVFRLMEPNKKRRYATPDELLQDIRHFGYAPAD